MSDHLHPVQDALDDDQAARLSREEMLALIPEGVVLADEVEWDSPDPAADATGYRTCVAERRAGGRCQAPPPLNRLLCMPHAGLLDPAAGGRAKAAALAGHALEAEEVARLARLGARGVIAVTANANPALVRKAFLTLLEDAARGDRAAARLVGPWLNQGLGMPTETVVVSDPESATDLAAMSTTDLAAFVAAKRAGGS